MPFIRNYRPKINATRAVVFPNIKKNIRLCGESPFQGITYDEIVSQNYECAIDYSIRQLNVKVSRECLELLQSLLQKDPAKRISALEALDSPWFKKFKISSQMKLQSPTLILSQDQIEWHQSQEEKLITEQNMNLKYMNNQSQLRSPKGQEQQQSAEVTNAKTKY